MDIINQTISPMFFVVAILTTIYWFLFFLMPYTKKEIIGIKFIISCILLFIILLFTFLGSIINENYFLIIIYLISYIGLIAISFIKFKNKI